MIPFFRAFGAELQLDTVLFRNANWQGYIKLEVSGYGPIRKVTNTQNVDYRCELHSGHRHRLDIGGIWSRA